MFRAICRASARDSSVIASPASIRAISSHALVAVDRAHGRRRGTVCDRLFDDEVMVGLGRDRRQVGHREHLLLVTNFAKALADLLGDLTANPGVDLVKDRHHVLVRRLEGQGEQDAAQLSPARQGLQRALGLAGVGREEDLDVRAVVAVDRRSARSACARATRGSWRARPPR